MVCAMKVNTPVPTYQRIAQALRNQIKAGKVNPDGYVGSEVDLMHHHRVARMTVRRAIDLLIADHLVERRPGKGIYLTTEKSVVKNQKNVWLVIDNFGRESFVHFARAAEKVARQYNIHLTLKDGMAETRENLRILYELTERKDVHGAIIVAWHAPEFLEAICTLKNAGFPFVLLDYHNVMSSFPTVVADNYRGGALIAQHVYEQGHRNMIFIGDCRASTVQKRLDGFRDYLAEHDLPLPASAIWDISPTSDYFSDWIPGIDTQLQNLFAPENRRNCPTAIIASSDSIAKEIYRWCKKNKIAIPGDVSLVGFDNEPLSSLLNLTTVSQPFSEMGKQALLLLHSVLKGTPWNKTDVILPVELLPRESTAPLK